MKTNFTQATAQAQTPPKMKMTTAISIPSQGAELTAAEARAIAKEAYVYGFPIVDNYRIQYAYFVNQKSPEYKAPWNELRNIPRVFTPEDKAIQTPNSDTPYSFIGLDLRAEPMVLTIPPIEKGRYFSVQLIDLYRHQPRHLGGCLVRPHRTGGTRVELGADRARQRLEHRPAPLRPAPAVV